MKNLQPQQEILLFTNTRFSSMDWQKVEDEKPSGNNKIEKLTEACWNGLLDEILPEILQAHADKKINLWNINVASSFLDLQFSKYPAKPEEVTSVNPYLFLRHRKLN